MRAEDNQPEKDGRQCPASFQTPDGQRYYCQNKAPPHLKDGEAGRHLYNVARHPVTWRGTASKTGDHCGNPDCHGNAALQVLPFDPASNDPTSEVI